MFSIIISIIYHQAAQFQLVCAFVFGCGLVAGTGLRELLTGGFLGGDTHGLVPGSCHPGAALQADLRLHRPAHKRKLANERQDSTDATETQASEDGRGPGAGFEISS